MSLIAATGTSRGYARACARRGPAQTRSSAGQSEQTNSLGVGRNSPAADPRDRRRELCLEVLHVRARERRRRDVVRRLEELVRDLDLGRAGAEADERIDEPLQHVLGVDDLGRRPPFERVRLVVDDERAVALPPQDVEPATEHDAVVLEGERALGPSAAQSGDAPRERRAAVRVDESRRSARAPRRAPPDTTRARCGRAPHAAGAAGSSSGTSSSRRCTASPSSVAASPPDPPFALCGRRGGRPRTRSAK